MRFAYMIGLSCVVLLTACGQKAEPGQKAQLPNPASVFCIEQGGRHETVQKPNGAIGYCHLPNGEIVEEWAYYRAHLYK